MRRPVPVYEGTMGCAVCVLIIGFIVSLVAILFMSAVSLFLNPTIEPTK